MESLGSLYVLGLCLSGMLATLLYRFDDEFADSKTKSYLNDKDLQEEIEELRMLMSEDELIIKLQNISIFLYSLYSWIGLIMLICQWIKIKTNKLKKD